MQFHGNHIKVGGLDDVGNAIRNIRNRWNTKMITNFQLIYYKGPKEFIFLLLVALFDNP